MSTYSTSTAAIAAAKTKASRTEAPVYIMSGEGGPYELLSEAALEDAFASGDMTEFEFRRDHLATAYPEGQPFGIMNTVHV